VRRLLVIGRSGQLATALGETALPEGFQLVCRGRDQIDLARAGEARAAIMREQPALVINAAAYTAVDRAESEPDLVFAINRDGPAAIAEACQALTVPLIHLSSDYVFDGRKPAPYGEDDPVNPISVYGASKAQGEAAIRERLDAHLILRSSWIYAPTGQNFVRTMLRLRAERSEIRVVADQTGSPTAAEDLARAVIAGAVHLLSGRLDHGTFHFCGAGSTSWFGFAEAIFALGPDRDPSPRLIPIGTAEYPTPAHRPANSVLDTRKFASIFGLEAPPWRESLARCLRQIAARETTAA
jgi:dTDP-4-dehydrorhamnose reductase